VFWIGVESGPELKQLATAVDKAMAQLGIAKEDHAFNPHLTLARGGKSGSPRWQRSDRPNAAFSRLQEKLSAMSLPEFGTMTAREFYLYESKLSPRGAQYTKIEQYELG
jgi:2'-5' RNA ligase